MTISLDQWRAQNVLAHLNRYPKLNPACGRFWRDYAASANALPPAVRGNGLILALATEVSRASAKLEAGQMAVLADLCAYLGAWSAMFVPGWLPDVEAKVSWPHKQRITDGEVKAWQTVVVAGAQCTLETLIGAERSRYQVIGEEALTCLAWLKTLARTRSKAEEKAEDEAKKKHKAEAKAAEGARPVAGGGEEHSEEPLL